MVGSWPAGRCQWADDNGQMTVEGIGMGRLTVEGDMRTDLGKVSETNEDAVAFVVPPASPADSIAQRSALDLLAVLADGMGGQAAGEVASRLAVETVIRCLPNTDMPLPEALARCMADANQHIRARRESDPACADMGTTCTILLVQDDALFLGHVGDSRAYLCRAGTLQQLSEDHSAVRELVRGGQLTEAEARNSPMRNIILRALGLKPEIEPLIWSAGVPLLEGDILVMCSDGLTDGVADDAIAETVSALAPRKACEALIDAAIQAGGRDNISVGVFALRARQKEEPDMDATRRIDPIKVPE